MDNFYSFAAGLDLGQMVPVEGGQMGRGEGGGG